MKKIVEEVVEAEPAGTVDSPEEEYDESCVDIAKELVDDLKAKGYSQESVNQAMKLVATLEKEAGMDEHDSNHYDNMNAKDMRKDLVKKGIVISLH